VKDGGEPQAQPASRSTKPASALAAITGITPTLWRSKATAAASASVARSSLDKNRL